MFGRDADEVIAAATFAFGDAADSEIVALGRAAREDNFLGAPIAAAIDVRAPIDGIACFVAGGMDAVGIGVFFVEERQHRLDHEWVNASRGVVVQVDCGLGVGGHRS